MKSDLPTRWFRRRRKERQELLINVSQRRVVFLESYQGYGRGSGVAAIPHRWWIAIVLAALLSKVVLSSVPKTRSLFLRISIFFIAYSVADAIYLYAEAAWQNMVGSYLDLLWSVASPGHQCSPFNGVPARRIHRDGTFASEYICCLERAVFGECPWAIFPVLAAPRL